VPVHVVRYPRLDSYSRRYFSYHQCDMRHTAPRRHTHRHSYRHMGMNTVCSLHRYEIRSCHSAAGRIQNPPTHHTTPTSRTRFTREWSTSPHPQLSYTFPDNPNSQAYASPQPTPASPVQSSPVQSHDPSPSHPPPNEKTPRVTRAAKDSNYVLCAVGGKRRRTRIL